jgi:hypothetical protein
MLYSNALKDASMHACSDDRRACMKVAALNQFSFLNKSCMRAYICNIHAAVANTKHLAA